MANLDPLPHHRRVELICSSCCFGSGSGNGYEDISAPSLTRSLSQPSPHRLSCWPDGGWLLGSGVSSGGCRIQPFRDRDSDSVVPPGCSSSSSSDAYHRPPRWKQAIRKLKAETRKRMRNCSKLAQTQPPYDSLSYAKNFDEGGF